MCTGVEYEEEEEEEEEEEMPREDVEQPVETPASIKHIVV